MGIIIQHRPCVWCLTVEKLSQDTESIARPFFACFSEIRVIIGGNHAQLFSHTWYLSLFFTPTQLESQNFYTQKWANLQQKLSFEKTALTMVSRMTRVTEFSGVFSIKGAQRRGWQISAMCSAFASHHRVLARPYGHSFARPSSCFLSTIVWDRPCLAAVSQELGSMWVVARITISRFWIRNCRKNMFAYILFYHGRSMHQYFGRRIYCNIVAQNFDPKPVPGFWSHNCRPAVGTSDAWFLCRRSIGKTQAVPGAHSS